MVIDSDILAAIDCNDAIWVKKNWSGVIAKKWSSLSNELTTILNTTYNGGE